MAFLRGSCHKAMVRGPGAGCKAVAYAPGEEPELRENELSIMVQRTNCCPPFPFFKDQAISHCSHPSTVHPEGNSGGRETGSTLHFGYTDP